MTTMGASRMISIHHIDGNLYNDATDNLVLVDAKDPSRRASVTDDALSRLLRSRMEKAQAKYSKVFQMVDMGEIEPDDGLVIWDDYREAREAYHELIKTRVFSGM